MKRIISIILTVVLLLPSIVTASSSSFRDLSGREYYAQAAEQLQKAQILSGYEDDTFKPEKNITRAEMAAVICRLMCLESLVADYQGYTTDATRDVSETHWASGYVNIAVERGIINGYGDGLFKPNNNVKFEEAVKMVVCATGLDILVENDVNDWAAGYIDVADMMEITKSVQADRGEYINRGDIAIMIYQALGNNQNVPVASVPSGYYTDTQYVDLEIDGDADIYYSVRCNSGPVEWIKYTGESIELYQTCELHTVAQRNGVNVSSYEEYFYQFDSKPRSLSFEYDNDCLTINTNESEYLPGEVIYLKAQPRKGYEFDGWEATSGTIKSPDKQVSEFVMPFEDVVITAHHKKSATAEPDYEEESVLNDYNHYDENGNFIKYTLTVTMTGCGGIRDTSGKYAAGDNVPLYIYPGTEDSFIKWTATAGVLHNPESPTCVITMPDEDVVVCAEFADATETVTPPQSEQPTITREGLEDEVLRLVNEARKKEGLKELKKDTGLRDVARAHSEDMAKRGFFNHTNPDNETPYDRMKAYGIQFRAAGENIAMGQRTAEVVMNGWMNSEGHRKNILSEHFEYLGVGLYVKDGTYYWTQCFKG